MELYFRDIYIRMILTRRLSRVQVDLWDVSLLHVHQFPFFKLYVFTIKLSDSVVWPVLAYGASVCGYKTLSCINTVQIRPMVFYLGVGKCTYNTAVAEKWVDVHIVSVNGASL